MLGRREVIILRHRRNLVKCRRRLYHYGIIVPAQILRKRRLGHQVANRSLIIESSEPLWRPLAGRGHDQLVCWNYSEELYLRVYSYVYRGAYFLRRTYRLILY